MVGTSGPRSANLIVAPIYLLFSIGFLVDATEVWEYYIGVFYLLFSLAIIWHAYKWPTTDQRSVGHRRSAVRGVGQVFALASERFALAGTFHRKGGLAVATMRG